MDTTANLNLPLILPSQAQKHVTHNEAIAKLDALVQLAVVDRDLTDPPGSPADGDRHIVAATATDAWAGHEDAIALFEGGGWRFLEPKSGWTAWVEDEGAFVVWDGAAWTPQGETVAALQNLSLLGVGTTADETNPFAARLNKALWTARTAGEGGDGDLRWTLNKETPGDVLSLVFQSGFSGRAEIGLVGDDDLAVKVSADGSAWAEALRIDRATGVATFPQTGSLAMLAAGAFHKADDASPAFVKTSATSISIKAGTVVELAGLLHVFASATAVSMPTLNPGTDYAIYVCDDGSVRADASFVAPSGFDASTSRRIGGFHYAAGGNASGTSGGDTTPSINEHSVWDPRWRPACPDPRGMALVAGAFWCDLYLLGVNHHVDGTSRYNAIIADGSSPPKVPAAFGGDGTATYSSLTWFDAAEVMQSHGKSLLAYAEFAAAAFGASENQSRGSDPVTTGLSTTNSGSANADEEATSRWGIVQATGCQWVWGREFQYFAAGADAAAIQATSWKNNTGSRGQILSQNTQGMAVTLYGGGWTSGANSGTRAATFTNAPWASNAAFGARGRSDHFRC